jgi:signal transduction histidine kinase
MHVTVRFDADVGLIVTDAVRLRSALVNLISNACQAVETKTSRSVGTSGAHIVPLDPTAVTVATRRAGNRVEVTITDRGGGIPREDQPRAFDPYFTTRRGGTGIGLPIAKNIVDGLGGTITLSSVSDGTEVRVDLPAEAPR